MTPRTKVAGHPNWKPGESGNPAGPPKGSVRPSAKLRKLIDVPRIIKKLQKAAEDGDVQAARTLLERALPALRPQAEPVLLPALAAAETPQARADAVSRAIADGTLAPDIGAMLLNAFNAQAKLADLEASGDVRIIEDERPT